MWWNCGGGEPWLSDRLHCFDFRYVRFEISLDPKLQRHRAGGATDARAVKADLDGAVWSDPDELDIAPVGLHGRADEVNHLGDAVVDRIGGIRASGGGMGIRSWGAKVLQQSYEGNGPGPPSGRAPTWRGGVDSGP
jgi:hypothetical protein